MKKRKFNRYIQWVKKNIPEYEKDPEKFLFNLLKIQTEISLDKMKLPESKLVDGIFESSTRCHDLVIREIYKKYE